MKKPEVQSSSEDLELQSKILNKKEQDNKAIDLAMKLAIKRAIKYLERLQKKEESVFWQMISKMIRELKNYRKPIIGSNYIADLKLIANLVNDTNEDPANIKDQVNQILSIPSSSPLRPLALVASAFFTYETETVNETLKPDARISIAQTLLRSKSIQQASENLEALLNNHYNPTNILPQEKSSTGKELLIDAKVTAFPLPAPPPPRPVTMLDQYDRVVQILKDDKADLVKVNDAVREFMGRHGAALDLAQKNLLNDLIDEKLPSTDFLKKFPILSKNILGENVNPINIYYFIITTKADAFLDGYVSRMGEKFGNNYGDRYDFYKELLTKKYLSTLGSRDDLNKTAKTILFKEAKLENKAKLGSIERKISIVNSDETLLAITMILYYGTCENQSWYSRSKFI